MPVCHPRPGHGSRFVASELVTMLSGTASPHPYHRSMPTFTAGANSTSKHRPRIPPGSYHHLRLGFHHWALEQLQIQKDSTGRRSPRRQPPSGWIPDSRGSRPTAVAFLLLHALRHCWVGLGCATTCSPCGATRDPCHHRLYSKHTLLCIQHPARRYPP